MRIAFVSCFSTRIVSKPPIWDWIAAAKPDHLLLLGDSLYLDVNSDADPKSLSENDFAMLLHRLYSDLVTQPKFSALVQALPAGHVHAIWDDHDFLWNDAEGAEVAQDPQHREKIPLTTAFMEAFRKALKQQLAPGSFPGQYNDPVFWHQLEPLSTPSVELDAGVHLHLSDGRSHRTRTWLISEKKRALFGRQQLDRLAKYVLKSPAQDIHLLASGSPTQGWYKFSRDRQAILDLAAERRMLVLSGDVHRNELHALETTQLPLHEATSSGAAIRELVGLGSPIHNHGLLDITPTELRIQLFKKNQLERERRIARGSWLPLQ
jgi:alkaline phosphatase D